MIYTIFRANDWMWSVWVFYWIISAKFVNRTEKSEGTLARLAHLVPVLTGMYLIFFIKAWSVLPRQIYHDSVELRVFGTLLTAAGLGFAVWARIHLGKYWSGTITLKEGHKLIRTGPYRFVRHPIYTGMLTAAAGSSLTFGTWTSVIGLVLITAAFLRKIAKEEKLLLGTFGGEYEKFVKEVPGLVPFLRR